jgi:hypothetical protein
MNDDSFTALSGENVSMSGCGNKKKERRKIKKGNGLCTTIFF